ncbi:UPF0184 protein-like [Centruroides sculpturatus]|uniref:UPF0184 protein-like n=1 Tax=Centruroides sculpturatus TaxID=218467 RepID=UPI000C6C9274|nr:UPF0184 protein-like [Centruroides sculpturatus]
MSDGSKMKSLEFEKLELSDGILTEEELQEYEALNLAMDQLNSCLDVLEQQNNSLNAELRQFIETHKKEESERKDSCETSETK